MTAAVALVAAGVVGLAALAAITLWENRRHRMTGREMAEDLFGDPDAWDRVWADINAPFPGDAHGRRDTPGPHEPETTYQRFT